VSSGRTVTGDIAQARRCGVVEIAVGTRKRRRRRALPTKCSELTRSISYCTSSYKATETDIINSTPAGTSTVYERGMINVMKLTMLNK
jgi:hypothetical protein